MYKMVDIRAKTWNNVRVSAIRIHEKDNVCKILLLLLWISDISEKWGCGNIIT